MRCDKPSSANKRSLKAKTYKFEELDQIFYLGYQISTRHSRNENMKHIIHQGDKNTKLRIYQF